MIFVAYLSALCRNPLHTATQYALLTALAAVGRTYLSSGAGFVAEATGWLLFFVICVAGRGAEPDPAGLAAAARTLRRAADVNEKKKTGEIKARCQITMILERDAGGKPLHTFPHPALKKRKKKKKKKKKGGEAQGKASRSPTALHLKIMSFAAINPPPAISTAATAWRAAVGFRQSQPISGMRSKAAASHRRPRRARRMSPRFMPISQT